MAESVNKEIPDNVPVIGSAPPRDNLIKTAVNFLQNPKVQSSPLQQKKDFLQRKGLSDEEINLAIERAGVVENSQGTISHVAPVPPLQHQAVAPVEPVSTLVRIRDYSALAVIVGGVAYALYSLFKNYVEPIFFKKHHEAEQKLARLEEGVQDINSELKKSMQDLQNVIGDLRSQLSDQTLKITQVSNNLALYKAETSNTGLSNSAIGELQAEITSVKGLLLSTKQFPAAPVSSPVIPTWQLKPAKQAEISDDQNAGENSASVAEDATSADPIESEQKVDSTPPEAEINGE